LTALSLSSEQYMNSPALTSPAAGLGAAVSASVQVPAKRPKPAGFSLGKYREVVIAVALFLIFDLGVLVLNFYISFQISEDATAINLAGRQRMLSQRTTKAIYAVEDQIAQTGRAGDDGKELGIAIKLFDNTLKAFRDGGAVAGGDGKSVELKAVTSPKAQEAIAQTQALWFPLLEKANALLLPNPTPEQLRDAVAYARANNVDLLGRMNDMTTALEQDAADRASRLRLVQTVGIVLALLNFVFILFKFIRSLRRADETAEQVANENREILASVREGLFLITPELRVGTQIAKASHDLFGKPVHAGDTFLDVLKPLVSNKVLQDSTDYLDLLFTPHVKEQLVQSINPLSDVQIFVNNRLGKSVVRHLSFAFNRTIVNDNVTHLLVTVQDITQRKELEAALQEQKQGAQKEIGMILKALETDSGQLAEFSQRSERELLEVNLALRELSSSTSARQSQTVIESIFRRVHAFKGEAQTLGLDVLSLEAHALENLLAQMRSGEVPEQDALLHLPIHLESLLSKLSMFSEMAARRQSAEQATVPTSSTSSSFIAANIDSGLMSQLKTLASDVARDTGKSVELTVDMPGLSNLAAVWQQFVKDISIQLVRNAVVHGVEAPSQRVASGKPVVGQVSVSLASADGQWLLSVRDDGAGISAARIREQLGKNGWYSAAQLQTMDDKTAIAHIFKPGFSTASAQAVASLHAGRGVGLDVVQAQAKRLGAQLGLGSVPGQYTEFRLKFVGGQS
jgi:two-component system, chemotaxis family, sensor kinase CheA